MKHIEIKHLQRLCKRAELDPMEIDSSITYWENKRHLLGLVPNRDLDELGTLAVDRYEAQIESRHTSGSYHKGAICPKCSKEGSGLHAKWVLNERKQRYEPYYYFAHSVKIGDRYRVKWHYVRKHQALEIMGSSWTMEQFNLRT